MWEAASLLKCGCPGTERATPRSFLFGDEGRVSGLSLYPMESREEGTEEQKRSRARNGRLRRAPAYSLARSKLITSSEVMTPVNFWLSSTTGRVSRLYLSNSSANCNSLASAWI